MNYMGGALYLFGGTDSVVGRPSLIPTPPPLILAVSSIQACAAFRDRKVHSLRPLVGTQPGRTFSSFDNRLEITCTNACAHSIACEGVIPNLIEIDLERRGRCFGAHCPDHSCIEIVSAQAAPITMTCIASMFGLCIGPSWRQTAPHQRLPCPVSSLVWLSRRRSSMFLAAQAIRM